MRAEFTPREVAELSGVTKAAVEKAIEERMLGPKKALRGRRTRRVLSAHAVAYAKIVGAVKYRLDLPMKRRLAATLAKSGSTELKTLRFELERRWRWMSAAWSATPWSGPSDMGRPATA